MGPFLSLCFLMVRNGSLLVLMRPYGFYWVSMFPYKSCVFMSPYGSF